MQISKSELEEFERLELQLRAFHSELTKLRDADAAVADQSVSEIKLATVNELIAAAAAFLDAGISLQSVSDGFPTASVSNSDITVVLGQYIACFDAYRSRRVQFRYGRYHWRVSVDGNANNIEYIAVDSVNTASGTD